jgi:hypothetical protein
MDKRMMALGGEKRRVELLSKISSKKISAGLEALTLDPKQ